MDYPSNRDVNESDEVRFKDVILKLRVWLNILFAKKTRIIILTLSVVFFALIYSKFIAKPLYTANYQLFFEEESGGISGAMRLASNFGLSLGSNSGNMGFKIQKYLKSRTNISHVMLDKSSNGRLIERYYYDYFERDSNFYKDFKINFESNQRYRDSILSEITMELNDQILSSFMDDETGILVFQVRGHDEKFVFELSNKLISHTEKVFLNWKNEKAQNIVNSFEIKVDSLETEIDAALLRYGEFEDQNNSLVRSVDMTQKMRLSIDLEALKVSYGEYIKGLEMSKADLMNLQTPFIYFDKPSYPLYKEKGMSLKSIIFLSITTLFISSLYFVLKSEVLRLMK